MANFLINTQAEFLKSKRTMAYRLSIISGICLPVLFMLGFIFKKDSFVGLLSDQPWSVHITNVWRFTAIFFSMFVAMLTSLVVQTEFRNNTWKLVYVQPRTVADIYFSKFMVIQLLLIGGLLILNLGILVTGYIANIIHANYGFFKEMPPLKWMFWLSFRMYIASLCISAIQYWLSLRFRNFITSLGLGIGLTIVSFIILKWDQIELYPYAYPALTFFKSSTGEALAIHEWNSLAGAALALVLGFWNIAKRKERG